MTAELAVSVAKLETRTEAHAETILAHADKISALEKWRYGVMGALAFASLQGSIAITLLVAYWRSHAQ